MGRMYTATFAGVAVTVAVDFFEFNTPATCSTVIHAIDIGQSTESGDAAEEFLRWFIKSAHTTSGTTGQSSATPAPLDTGNTMAALNTAVEICNTVQATGGTPKTHWASTFNVRAGLLWIPTPECRLVIAPSTRLVIGIASTPGDSITFDGTVAFEEQ